MIARKEELVTSTLAIAGAWLLLGGAPAVMLSAPSERSPSPIAVASAQVEEVELQPGRSGTPAVRGAARAGLGLATVLMIAGWRLHKHRTRD